MEFLFVITFFFIVYLTYEGINAYFDSVSQNIEVYAKEVKLSNQETLKELQEKVQKTIQKNDGWYTLEYIDEYIKDHVKTYNKENK